MITTPAKLVVEVWNIEVDFTAQLAPGETIVTGFVNLISANGLTAAYQSVSGNLVQITLSGGTAGQRSLIAVGVNTTNGEVLAEQVQIPVC